MEAAAADGDADQLRAVSHRLAGSRSTWARSRWARRPGTLEQHTLNDAMADAAAALPALAELMAADLEALRAYQREQFPARAG